MISPHTPHNDDQKHPHQGMMLTGWNWLLQIQIYLYIWKMLNKNTTYMNSQTHPVTPLYSCPWATQEKHLAHKLFGGTTCILQWQVQIILYVQSTMPKMQSIGEHVCFPTSVPTPIPTVSTMSTSPQLLNRDRRECDQFNQADDAPRSLNHVEVTYPTIY